MLLFQSKHNISYLNAHKTTTLAQKFRCSGNIHIKKVNPNQWGVFTSRPFTKGSIVISSMALHNNNTNTTNNNNCSHSIQIDWDKNILMDLPARFLNHSCGPNVGVGKRRRSKEEEEGSSRSNMNMNENGSYDFVALRDLDAGEVRLGRSLFLLTRATGLSKIIFCIT